MTTAEVRRGGPWIDTIRESLKRHEGDPTARYVQIATSAIGGGVSCRTVVFRGFWNEMGAVKFITDRRSSKVAEIAADPRAELCWYLRGTREQFRIGGSLQVVHAGEVDNTLVNLRRDQWTHISPSSQASFASSLIPGLTLEEADIACEERKEGKGGSVTSLENPVDDFCLVLLWPSSVDHLVLDGTHRRCLHTLEEGQGGYSDEGVGPKTGVWSSRALNP
ncbi:unnamed protein product [Choristocarpus tenellus]